ncbi:hypothetical protein MMC06_001929 [Schaereria dolodes]|nr:hypothetical protein [Schaereria dolodes]
MAPKFNTIYKFDMIAINQDLSLIPYEIWNIIFSALSHNDLKVLRTLCRKFAIIAQETLFRTVVVAPRKRELRILARVANHPSLKTCVKHLFYDLSRYPVGFNHPRAALDYQRYLRDKYQERFDSTRAENSWIEHNNKLKDQEVIIRHDREAEALALNLPKLENLRHITVSYKYRVGYAYYDVRTDKNNPNQPWRLSSFRTTTHVDEPLRLIFRAIKTAKVPIESFSLLHGDNSVEFSRNVFFKLPSLRQLSAAQHFFRTLKTIDLDFSHTLPSRVSYAHGRQGLMVTETCSTAVADLLQRAKGLRNLKLGFFHSGPARRDSILRSHLPLHMQVGETSYWKDLTDLTLSSMCLYSDELMDFLTRHISSLKRISLLDMTLLSGSWKTVAECLATFQLSSLCIERCGEGGRHPNEVFMIH